MKKYLIKPKLLSKTRDVLVMAKEFDEGFAQDTDQCDLLVVDDEPSFQEMLKVYLS